jgi:AFG3 family protein
MNDYEHKLIYFDEHEIHYKTILFTLFILLLVLNNKGKSLEDRLVSNLNLLIDTKSKYKLDDIAGMHEIKCDIKQYIDFINNKDKYSKFGARLPRGILLVGPPGCGKTLIAKSIAGETGVNMYAISASDINEMFVGVGSKRIRQLFEMARENSPSIIFIDEIDSIGMKRGSSHHEFDNVLNKILVEMDGFKDNENIMVFAATNRINDLDPALLRSGRFDRKIYIDYPNKKERNEIIEYYIKDKNIEYENKKELNDKLGKLMCGLSGADIENIINQSAIHAVKNKHENILLQDIYDACDEVMIGIKKTERIMSETERNIVAHHEVGHAIIGYLLKNTTPPIKISIVPRGENILGYAQQEPLDKKLYSKNELIDTICVLLGGRITEEVFFGKENITTGAMDDIEKLTKIINRMLFEYGMFNKNYNYTNTKYISETVLAELNKESNKLVCRLEERVRELIESKKDVIKQLSQKLLDEDEIYNDDIEKIVGIKYKSTV